MKICCPCRVDLRACVRAACVLHACVRACLCVNENVSKLVSVRTRVRSREILKWCHFRSCMRIHRGGGGDMIKIRRIRKMIQSGLERERLIEEAEEEENGTYIRIYIDTHIHIHA